jgi:hypothetical protein
MGCGIGPGREPTSTVCISAEVRQARAFVTSGCVGRRLVAILSADVAGVSWVFVLQQSDATRSRRLHAGRQRGSPSVVALSVSYERNVAKSPTMPFRGPAERSESVVGF